MKTVCYRAGARPRFSLFVLLVCLLTLAAVSCRKEESDFGAGQRAQKKEAQLQNKTLLEQFVIASEELENHPDPAYFENALVRLNPWLESCAPSRDFQPCAEFDARSEEFRLLAETAEEIHTLCAKVSAPREGDAAGAAGLSDDEAGALAEKADLFLQRVRELNRVYHSPLLAQFEAMAAEFKSKMAEAEGFQFGGRGKMVSAAVARFPFTPLMNFHAVGRGAAELARLYRLDTRAFLPADTAHFKSSVWQRNVVSWAKGEGCSPAEQAVNLFRWTCDAVPLRAAADGPLTADSIARLPWQTLLTSQGNAAERAAVFMGLLRQIGISSFLIRPVDPARSEGFPLLVGAAVPVGDTPSVLLFLPEYGVPVPGMSKSEGGVPLPATLDEAAGDDALLRRLDVEGEPFPLTSADLAQVRAEVPTDPFNMSHRMWIMMRESVIERSGAAQDNASFIPPILALSYESVRSEIGALPHIADVGHAWELQTPVVEQTLMPIASQVLLIPYLYEVAASNSLSMRADDDGSKKYAPTEGTGSGGGETPAATARMACPLWEGKILYFKGDFDSENGAANRLQQGRVPDRLLKQASLEMGARLDEYITQIQQAQGESDRPLTDEEMRAAAAQFIAQGRQDLGMKFFLKVTARFYLGLVSYALQNDEAAATHFEDADLLGKLDGMWKSGALTILAEIYEKQGETARAEKIYNRLEGPAARGGKVRAKWLREGE